MVKLRSKNRITLPGKVVALAGLKEGDFLNVTADGTRIVITAQEIRERGAGYTMSDLLGAASGIYDSAAEIDAEIADGRASRREAGDAKHDGLPCGAPGPGSGRC